MYGTGISKEGEIVDLAVKLDIIQKSGAWFSCGDTRLAQGRDNTKNYLRDHPEFADDIEAKVRANMNKLIVHPSAPRGSAAAMAAAAAAAPEAAPAAPESKASARAKLDIAVDDDE